MSNECCLGKNDYIMGKNDLPSHRSDRSESSSSACSAEHLNVPFGVLFLSYLILSGFNGYPLHQRSRGSARGPDRRRWGRGEPAEGLGSAASPRTHRWCWVQPLYGRARARCVSMRPPAAPCLHTPREATVTLEVPRKGSGCGGARARTGCARVCCAFEHTVSYVWGCKSGFWTVWATSTAP